MNTLHTQLASRFSLDPLDLILERLWGRPLGQEATASALAAVDLFESDSHYHAQFDLPGVAKENISVKARENTLEVTAKRPGPSGETVLQRELALPDDVRDAEITATHENGVLHLAIAKPALARTRVITIN